MRGMRCVRYVRCVRALRPAASTPRTEHRPDTAAHSTGGLGQRGLGRGLTIRLQANPALLLGLVALLLRHTTQSFHTLLAGPCGWRAAHCSLTVPGPDVHYYQAICDLSSFRRSSTPRFAPFGLTIIAFEFKIAFGRACIAPV